MKNQYRYPGAQPFYSWQQKIFFGREKEAMALYDLIELEQLVVLYSKSGFGKSSLLNAGLLPLVKSRGRMEPVSLRFGAYIDGREESPVDIVRNHFSSQSGLLDKICPNDDSLWYHLKNRQLASGEQHSFLLIIDQFEELFTYPEEEIREFGAQLSELLFVNIPDRFRSEIEAGFKANPQWLSTEELQALHENFNLKTVFAVRSDRLSLLNKLSPYLNNILENCYELGALSPANAEDAILNPAFDQGDYLSPVFDFENEAIESLIDFLSQGGTQPIESFQLQVLCEYLEQKVVIGQGKKLITREDIQKPEVILENYYLDKINNIPNEEGRLAARKLIEEGLIFEEEERRLSLYEGQILKNYGISPALLQELQKTHLIRSEPSMRGGYTYELSHDTLVAPVLEAKARRRETERREYEKKEQERRQKELAELREKAAIERQRAEQESHLRKKAEEAQRKARSRFRVAIAGLLLALAFAVLTGISYKWAKDEESLALENAEKASLNARRAEENLAKFKEAQLIRIEEEAKAFEAAGEYWLAWKKWEEAVAIDSSRTDLMQRMNANKKRAQ